MVAFTRLISVAVMAAVSSVSAAPTPFYPSLDKPTVSKRGAAYNDVSLVKSLQTGKSISWAYNWNMDSDGDLPEGVVYAPMLWGTKMLDGWSSAVEKALSAGSKMIFGFNEPDIGSQSALSVSQAVSLFRQYITPYADRASLATPAVTNSVVDGQGLAWLQQFLEECSDCKISTLALHWYGESVEDFKSQVNKAADLAQQHGLEQVWVTEFALNDASQATPFLKQALPFLDAHPAVGGYAYYYCAPGYLVDGAAGASKAVGAAALSDAGKTYTTA